ncbi:hypothetical protein [Salinisphaera sp. T31B1]|uniref:carbohydrate porin n=1 Tax=Salinisphaera sp. T31B1 TaxID=727963 RepID=UPI0033421A7B
MNHRITAACVLMLTGTGLACAADQSAAQGAEQITAQQGNTRQDRAAVSGILIGTFQNTSQDRVDGQSVEAEGNGQLYLFGDRDMGPGTWHLEVRAGTTPRSRGVTRFYGEVNDSVGETVDADGNGRIAATQFYYELDAAGGDLAVGLLDATGLLDANDVADDEYTQFLGTSFVNNPSVDYPSFALGADYQRDINDNLGFQAFLSSSGGLGDQDDPTYGNVFDVGESGKGVFAGTEMLWEAGPLYGDVGVWYNGADHTELAHPGRDRKTNYGTYTSIGSGLAGGQWVAQGGIANDKVAAAANFMGLAYEHPAGDVIVGTGVARIGVSDDQPEPADSVVQAEVYARIPLGRDVYVTPDLQYVNNSGFDPTLDDVLVAGARAGLEF